jgi:hypothetical protein
LDRPLEITVGQTSRQEHAVAPSEREIRLRDRLDSGEAISRR